jgi:hypothetical protein
MQTFNPSATRPARAVQAWQILVGKAMNRQTLTYEDLALLMFRRHAAGVLDATLGHIAFYCIENDLPPLTSIVVGKHRGRPGGDISIDLESLDEQREKVYRYDWYNARPPSEEELTEAYSRHVS